MKKRNIVILALLAASMGLLAGCDDADDAEYETGATTTSQTATATATTTTTTTSSSTGLVTSPSKK
jgi:hypothetical protein